MGTLAGNYYGGIVKDGLVLMLDAAKKDSYDRLGTTWRDISWNGKNGSLNNFSPQTRWNENNNGSIVMDGTNDFISFPGNTFSYSPGTTGEITLEMWVYPTGPYTSYTSEPPLTNLGCLFGQSYANSSRGWGVSIGTAGGVNYFNWQVRSFGNVVFIGNTTTTNFTNNSWYHIVCTFTRNDFIRIYINGTLRSSGSTVSLNGVDVTPNLNDAAIGVGGISSFYTGARVSIARIYNKPLSISEVLQNYNATKGRYNNLWRDTYTWSDTNTWQDQPI